MSATRNTDGPYRGHVPVEKLVNKLKAMVRKAENEAFIDSVKRAHAAWPKLVDEMEAAAKKGKDCIYINEVRLADLGVMSAESLRPLCEEHGLTISHSTYSTLIHWGK